MIADPAAQLLLLQLADIDTRARQAEVKRRTLPVLEELAKLNVGRVSLSEANVKLKTQIADAEIILRRIDADLDPAKARMTRNQKRLDDGLVNDPRSIKSTQDEIEHLKGRISDLEDQQLEIMQGIEDGTAKLDADTAQLAAITAKMRELIAQRDVSLAEIDTELSSLQTKRESIAAKLPADLLDVYDHMAARSTTGAALLRAGKCTGCGLSLDSVTLAKIAAALPAEVVRCDECGRILVRTGESGL
jgi:predicted  nucleic acid-binding Zn-ribbon protein